MRLKWPHKHALLGRGPTSISVSAVSSCSASSAVTPPNQSPSFGEMPPYTSTLPAYCAFAPRRECEFGISEQSSQLLTVSATYMAGYQSAACRGLSMLMPPASLPASGMRTGCLTLWPPTWLHSNTLTMSPKPRCWATVRSRRASGGPNLPQRASLVCRHQQVVCRCRFSVEHFCL